MGITLLTLYGDKVVDWVAGLFKVKDALRDVVSYQQNLSKITSEGARNSARERVELDALYKATQNHKRSLEERNKAADELQKNTLLILVIYLMRLFWQVMPLLHINL